MMVSSLYIVVVYALVELQEERVLTLPDGASVGDAVEASGLLLRYPEIDLKHHHALGIFSRPVKPETLLRDHDRVEIYRPLQADPKLGRKKRVEAQRAMKKKT